MTRFQRLEAAGWSLLHGDEHSETWISERITVPDQEAGRRERMFKYAEAAA